MSTLLPADERTLDYALDYALVDVFAERVLEGNQLAIFTDARGLTTEQMQALARETNLAESTFILPEEDETAGVRVRIFTVQEELPFAGHPTLGTASWLFWNHATLRGASEITLRLKAGNITVRFEPPIAERPGVFGTMQQFDPVFGAIHSREEVARALGVPFEDLDPHLPIRTVSTGMPFCIVPLRSLAAMQRLAIPQAIAQAYLARTDAKFFYCTTAAEPGRGAHFHSRMQFYNGEDPATGAASGCAIAYLVRHKVVASGCSTIFEQGSKFCGHPEFMRGHPAPTAEFMTCLLEDALFPLHPDAFSIAMLELLHRRLSRNRNNYAPAHKSVDERVRIRCVFT